MAFLHADGEADVGTGFGEALHVTLYCFLENPW